MGAIILPGVIIGEGSVIGAGAVVTANLEPYGVYVGVPARMTRRYYKLNIIPQKC